MTKWVFETVMFECAITNGAEIDYLCKPLPSIPGDKAYFYHLSRNQSANLRPICVKKDKLCSHFYSCILVFLSCLSLLGNMNLPSA